MAIDPIRIEPVTLDNRDDLDELFARGDPRFCQCAYLRVTNAEWRKSTQASNRDVHRQAIADAVDAGRSAGLIAYDDRDGEDGAPIGWVSFDPREQFPRLEQSKVLGPVDDKPVWSIVCFVIAARARRQGLAGRLLDAAVDYARDHGVRLLEAYPVATTGEKRSSSDLWHGTTSMFERAGFTTVEVRRHNKASPPRPIMRKAIRPRRRAT